MAHLLKLPTYTQIQVKQLVLVQHVTNEQMHCRTEVTAPGTTFLITSFSLPDAVCEVTQRSKPQ